MVLLRNLLPKRGIPNGIPSPENHKSEGGLFPGRPVVEWAYQMGLSQEGNYAYIVHGD